jgi:hypothetical protein
LDPIAAAAAKRKNEEDSQIDPKNKKPNDSHLSLEERFIFERLVLFFF